MSTYALAQSALLLLFALLFMAVHRMLLARDGYRCWLETMGGASGQWLFVFPLAAIVYAVPAAGMFATVRRPVGALLPCAVGLAIYLLLKNLIYAVLRSKPSQEAWDGAAFVLMIGFLGLWIFGASVLPLPGWAAWFGVDQVLIVAVVVVSFRVFRLPASASQAQPAAPEASRRKSHRSRRRRK
jgi:hypothetical protein